MCKKIFFDQNIWINLNKYKEQYKSLLDMLMQKIKNNNIKIYLTTSILWETGKDTNIYRKKELINFITDYTNSNVIIPFFKIFPLEINNYINKKINEPIINLDNFIFKEGFSYLFGCKGKIIPIDKKNVNDKKIKEATDFINSKEAIIKIISNEKICDIFREYNDPFGVYDTLIDMRNKIINDPLIKGHSKKRKLEVLIADYFVNDIFPLIIDKQVELKLPKDLLLKENSTKEDFYELLKELPSLNTYFKLLLRKSSDINRDLEINDSYDIMSYAITVPYCDIVVAENQFKEYITASKLSDTYKTKIISWSEINCLEQLIE